MPPERNNTFYDHYVGDYDHYVDDNYLRNWYTLYVPQGCVAAYKSSTRGDLTESIFDDLNQFSRFTIDGISYLITEDNIITLIDGSRCEGDLNLNTIVSYMGSDYLVKKIMQNAFSGSIIDTVNIPVSVDYIGYSAFNNCINLKKAILPSGIKYIENNTFLNCINLNEITLPTALYSIGSSAFRYCGFTSLKLPFRLQTVGDYAFAFCENLTSISFEKNVSWISNRALVGCTALNLNNT